MIIDGIDIDALKAAALITIAELNENVVMTNTVGMENTSQAPQQDVGEGELDVAAVEEALVLLSSASAGFSDFQAAASDELASLRVDVDAVASGAVTDLAVQKFSTGPISMGAANVPDAVLIDTATNSAAITLKLPPIATTAKIVRVADESRSANTYTIRIEPAIGDPLARFDGPTGPSYLELKANGQSVSLIPYLGHWYVT